ncbi:Inhibitor of growth protein 1 [Metarhizium brunneum]|uniref:Chromatin modification-related protein n=2 Tax=Opisthokonta TaxID=33154 RepID=A0A7D5V4F6_9HYPO
MPRDDLSIDFVKRMPQAEPLDPGLILDDWINRVQNLPEEIRFMHEEITDKDRQYNECIRMIEDRDGKIQKWIKSNGSHEPNPKEELLRAQIRDNFAKADRLAQDKIALTQKLQLTMDKHLRSIDIQIKLLYDRAEPGFTDPDEVPSLLRASAANHTAPSIRAINPSASLTDTAPPAATITTTHSNPATTRLPAHPHIRLAQPQQNGPQHSASAPATPAASMILNRQRESSAGPSMKRGPRANAGPGNAPTTSSGLARHSSLGPGTPKNASASGAGGVVRAGSAGPRSTSVKAGSTAGSRRGTPTAVSRKKPPNKSYLSRVKKASARNSPASTADSDLSEAESLSGEEEEEAGDGRRRGTPTADGKDAEGDDPVGDADDDEEEGGDDKKYCLCHNVSYGDMVACDNDNCPYEWFHWSCVGLKSEPNGTWYCPVCAEKFQRKAK